MNVLKPMEKNWAILLFKYPRVNFNGVVGPHTKELLIERRMVQLAER